MERRTLLTLPIVGLAAACGRRDTTTEPAADLGDFALGLNIVVTDKMQKVPISREVTGEQWQEVLKQAVEDRFRRYDATGTKLYNIGIAVDGYALAPPGIPIVAAPKSILVISVALFDDAAQQMLNPDRKGFQITAFERASPETAALGSGLTRTAEEQMAELAYVAVERIEQWMLENREWFGLPPVERRTERIER